METVIYWFSGTGNSLWAARELAARLSAQIKLVPLAGEGALATPPAERTILAYPVYAFGPPALVVDFAGKFQAAAGATVYSLATCAGLAGYPHHILHAALAARGLRLAAGWTLFLPTNCISLSKPAKPAKQEKMFAKASARLDAIAVDLATGRTGHLEDTFWPLGSLGGRINRAAVGSGDFQKGDSKFSVTGACNGCGLCRRVCPVANIEMAQDRPVWLHHCAQCMACLNWCPNQAIQYGKHTAGRGRYHHARIKPEDLMLRP